VTVATASAGAVAALPGGQALANIAVEVTGNSAAINDIANSWTTAADDATQYTAKISGAVGQVSADWHGSAADSFAALMQRFSEASTSAQEPLISAGQALNAAATALQTAQQKVDAVCESVLTQAGQIRDQAQSSGATTSQLNTALLQLTAQGVTQAQAYATQANTALQQASKVLSSAVSAMGKKPFSSLPAPGSDSFGAASTGTGFAPVSDPDVPKGGTGVSLSGTGTAGSGTAGSGTAGSGTASGSSSGWVAGAAPGSVQVSGTGDTGSGSGSGTVFPVSGGGTPAAPAQVDEWIQEAMKVLEAHGVPASDLSAQDIWTIIEHESSGNPDAVNNWDSNAAAGTPSEGLMQTISPTFEAYALPGYNSNILDPVSNIVAGVRYAISRYGSLASVPGVVAVSRGLPYVGY
jgi:uncharacterized protein YukE